MLGLRASRVFDGHALVDNPVVLLDGAHVVDVGVDPPGDAETIDLGDATILPGLVDCHQHLVLNGQGTLEEQVADIADDELLKRARANARIALQAGITTIRDVGDRNYVTLALRGQPDLPTLRCSGPPLTVPHGHCWYLGGETDPANVAKAVQEHHDRGCDLIKVMVSGGHLTPTYPMHESQFTTDDMRAIVAAAHSWGMPVAAHCHGGDSIVSALDARVDTIEHCTFMDATQASTPDRGVLQRMADAGIPITATVGALPGSSPPPVIQRNYDILFAALHDFRNLGGTVVVGTDAGIAPHKLHGVAPHALTDLTKMGVSRSEVLRALTADGANAIGLGASKGRLTPGYDADVLAVAGNPLDDGDLLTPIGVWCRGTRVR